MNFEGGGHSRPDHTSGSRANSEHHSDGIGELTAVTEELYDAFLQKWLMIAGVREENVSEKITELKEKHGWLLAQAVNLGKPIKVMRALFLVASLGTTSAPSQEALMRALNTSQNIQHTIALEDSKKMLLKLAKMPAAQTDGRWEGFIKTIEKDVHGLQEKFGRDPMGQEGLRFMFYGLLMNQEDNMIEKVGWANNELFWARMQQFLGHPVGILDRVEDIKAHPKDELTLERYKENLGKIYASEEYAHLLKICGAPDGAPSAANDNALLEFKKAA